MPKSKSRAKREAKQPSSRSGASSVPASRGSGSDVGAAPATGGAGWILPVGAILLVVAAGSTFMLVLQSIVGLTLPGCGEQSACGQATSSAWGKIPGLGWPTSHLGFAYFLALLVAWIAGRGRVAGPVRGLALVGAIMSFVLVIVMVEGGYLCPYCLVSHVANFLFVGLLEWSRRGAPRPVLAPRGLAAGAIAFVVATAGLAVAQVTTERKVEESREGELAESTEEIIRRSQEQIQQAAAAAADAGPARLEVPLEGRFLRGPENAPIRIVAFTDFQCPDCKRIEGEITEILAERNDVSFAMKHFPMCMDCNRFTTRTLHPNACWAARCAEAAGIMHGPEAFWKVHDWLFEKGGSFTAPELDAGLRGLGLDPGPITTVMQGAETLQRVRDDVEQGKALGLYFTPLVFINGTEVRGVLAKNAVRRALEALAATNPPPMGPDNDRPVLALEKYIEDWRTQGVRRVPPDEASWASGPIDAKVRVVVWGDYSEPNSRDLDRSIRDAIAGRTDVRYDFRHYPMNKDCNPSLQGEMRRDGACLGAKAAEAAGRLGGTDAFWKMHAWLFENQGTFDDASVRAFAGSIGLDPGAFAKEMEKPEVADAIAADARGANATGGRGVPHVIVNEKWLMRWKLDDGSVAPYVIEAARRE